MLAGLLADDVKKNFQSPRKIAAQIPLDIVVQYIASTFILVLDWLVETRRSLPPKEVNDLIRALIPPTLAATWE